MIDSARALEMLQRQMSVWEALAGGHRHLAGSTYGEFEIDGARLRAQCNPGRRTSNRAQVDPASIAARPCFLCTQNRPAAQESLPCGENWLLLANPAPIFPAHFTLVRRAHGASLVVDHLTDLFGMARALAPELSVFYNGPRAGASAPDHFHFQVYSRGWLPTEEELLGSSPAASAKILRSVNLAGLEVQVVATGGRGALVLSSPDPERLARAVRASCACLPATPGEEPDLNLVTRVSGDNYGVAIFPRIGHRPACYFATGSAQLLVSPGAADLAGLFVVTRTEDLDRLNVAVIRDIYRQVAMDGDTLRRHLEGGGHGRE